MEIDNQEHQAGLRHWVNGCPSYGIRDNERRGRLYAIGSCAQVGGFSAVDLNKGGREIKANGIFNLVGSIARPLVFYVEPVAK
jgi:hypothetical protein